MKLFTCLGKYENPGGSTVLGLRWEKPFKMVESESTLCHLNSSSLIHSVSM